jgi:hypothetical protein
MRGLGARTGRRARGAGQGAAGTFSGDSSNSKRSRAEDFRAGEAEGERIRFPHMYRFIMLFTFAL